MHGQVAQLSQSPALSHAPLCNLISEVLALLLLHAHAWTSSSTQPFSCFITCPSVQLDIRSFGSSPASSPAPLCKLISAVLVLVHSVFGEIVQVPFMRPNHTVAESNADDLIV